MTRPTNPLCQVVGCNGHSLAYATELEFDGVPIEVLLCPRHKRDLAPQPVVQRPKEASR